MTKNALYPNLGLHAWYSTADGGVIRAQLMIKYVMLRSNVCSKANLSQLNLIHSNDQKTL